MWLICGIVSVMFCIISLILLFNKNKKSMYASICSLTFVVLTFLMEYRMVFNWVNKEDWAALIDVVPFMFFMLTGYAIIMLLVNAVVLSVSRNY